MLGVPDGTVNRRRVYDRSFRNNTPHSRSDLATTSRAITSPGSAREALALSRVVWKSRSNMGRHLAASIRRIQQRAANHQNTFIPSVHLCCY
jgi:hypothetical protein